MLYVIGWREEGPVKVGRSIDPRGRLADMQIGNPYEMRLLATGRPVRQGLSLHWTDKNLERALHKQLKGFHMRGEWFDASVSTVTGLFPRGPRTPGHIEWHVYREAAIETTT